MKLSKIALSCIVFLSLSCADEVKTDLTCVNIESGLGKVCFDSQKMLNLLQNKNVDKSPISTTTTTKVTPVATPAVSVVTFKEEKVVSKEEKIEIGSKIYQAKCAECHGDKGDKEPYLVSNQLIKMTKDEIIDAVNGYKFRSESYNKGKSLIMYSAVLKLTYDEIEATAEYIQTLKK